MPVKFKLVTLLFMISAMTLILGCELKSNMEVTQPEKNTSSDQNLVYRFTDMEKVNIKRDIVYKNHNDKTLELDVYYALGNKDISKAPTVVLVHGIAPDNNLKDSKVYITWGKKIAASGFNAVIFNWRPSISSGDVSDLIKYIRENSKELNINSDNISLIAFSAGVYEGIRDAMQVNTGFIKNIIVYYGYLDDSILTEKTDVKLPSFFIAMAALDESFPPDMNDNFISKAEAAGCKVIKMVHSKAGHGFDAFNANDAETKNIIDKTLIFIEDGSNV